tara:strand:- start:1274 stop:1816 length:543 start_codon:yes stop_codon:yes gene_type:complete
MNSYAITAEEARRARTSLYLSQSKISGAIGVHRSKYALFEVKRYIFTEKEQLTLREHFESLGYVFPERPTVKEPTPQFRIIKRIAVPNRISTEKAKKALAQVSKNVDYIESKADEIAGLHWFSEELKSEVANEIIDRMAFNYSHLRWLMGLDDLLGDQFAEDMEPEKTTNGAIVNQRLYR